MLSFRAARAHLVFLWVEEGFVKEEAVYPMVDGKPGEGERAAGRDTEPQAAAMAGAMAGWV